SIARIAGRGVRPAAARRGKILARRIQERPFAPDRRERRARRSRGLIEEQSGMGFLRAATRCRTADRAILAFGQLRSDRTARHLRSAWRSHVTGSSESEVWEQVSGPTSVWRSIRTHAIRLFRVGGPQRGGEGRNRIMERDPRSYMPKPPLTPQTCPVI